MAHLYHVTPGTRLVAGETVALTGEEAHHAARVARLRVGERVDVGDGRGSIAHAEAVDVAKDSVSLVIREVRVHPRLTPQLWLVQSLAKSGRDEQAIEMATEVGVSGVIPLQAARSVVRWEGHKHDTGHERWQKIVKEASKQALQPEIPLVQPVAGLEDVLAREALGQLLLLDHRGTPLADHDVTEWGKHEAITVLVGPEGGFTEDEREACLRAGATMVRLGPGVLRTSSAGPVALALLHQLLGHW